MIEIDNIYNMDCIEGMKLMAVSYTHLDVYKRQVLFYLVAHLLSSFQCGFGKVAVRLLIFAEPSQQWVSLHPDGTLGRACRTAVQ